MGILDDAIRQHLELKRRQGAADAELARLEDEAFGPPTRPGEPDFPSSEAPAEAPGGADAEPISETDQAALAVEPEAAGAPPATAHSPAVDDPEGPAAVVADPPQEAGSDLEDLDLTLDDEFSDVGELESGPPPVASLDTVEHPAPIESLDTVEHAVEEAPSEEAPIEEGPAEADATVGEEEELEGEDVLEETTELLREQPEEDELWFDQGEPKDFDF